MPRRSGLSDRAEPLVPPPAAHADDGGMAICPICERSFDERAYQLVVRGLGAFDTFACADEAIRRQARRDRGELAGDLLDAVRGDPAAENEESRLSSERLARARPRARARRRS
jgi:hypothetical protein